VLHAADGEDLAAAQIGGTARVLPGLRYHLAWCRDGDTDVPGQPHPLAARRPGQRRPAPPRRSPGPGPL